MHYPDSARFPILRPDGKTRLQARQEYGLQHIHVGAGRNERSGTLSTERTHTAADSSSAHLDGTSIVTVEAGVQFVAQSGQGSPRIRGECDTVVKLPIGCCCRPLRRAHCEPDGSSVNSWVTHDTLRFALRFRSPPAGIPVPDRHFALVPLDLWMQD